MKDIFILCCCLMASTVTSLEDESLEIQNLRLDLTCPKESIELESPLRIGSWNVQKLGLAKLKKKDVVETIIQIMLRYDIIVLQEVMDASQTVPYELLELLNDAVYFQEVPFNPNDVLRDRAEDIFEIAISERIGRSRYKEQYAVYYREDRVIFNTSYQYNDVKDVFQVEPFVTVFETPNSQIERFALIPIHTSPGDAVVEIDALTDVYDAVLTDLGIEDAIILGDFNAGCTYVGGKDWVDIRLKHDTRFEWLISDHVDTTTKGTTCPYDRIVIAGTALKNSIYEESAKPFYFDSELGLEDEVFVKKVSDHYPVEVSIKPDASFVTKQAKIEIAVAVDFETNEFNLDILKENYEKMIEREEDRISKETEDSKEDEDKSLEYGDVYEEKDEFDDAISVEDDVGQESVENKMYFKPEIEFAEVPSANKMFYTKNRPKIIVNNDDVFVLQFQSKNVEDSITLLEELSRQYPCVFLSQETSMIKYKLQHQVLADTSVFYEGYTDVDIRTQLMCFKTSCKLLVSKATPVV